MVEIAYHGDAFGTGRPDSKPYPRVLLAADGVRAQQLVTAVILSLCKQQQIIRAGGRRKGIGVDGFYAIGDHSPRRCRYLPQAHTKQARRMEADHR
jgi:hypothetical protein